MPQSVPEDRPHSDLTRSILESAMRVQSALGIGLYEKPYKVWLCCLPTSRTSSPGPSKAGGAGHPQACMRKDQRPLPRAA